MAKKKNDDIPGGLRILADWIDMMETPPGQPDTIQKDLRRWATEIENQLTRQRVKLSPDGNPL